MEIIRVHHIFQLDWLELGRKENEFEKESLKTESVRFNTLMMVQLCKYGRKYIFSCCASFSLNLSNASSHSLLYNSESDENTIFEIIGKNGFIAVPTFNFKFAKGDDFDVDNTPSDGMGAFYFLWFNIWYWNETAYNLCLIELLHFISA